VCHIAKAEGNNISTRAAKSEGMTSETWPPPRSDEGNFPPSLCKFKSDFNVLKGSYECISYLLSTIVPDDEIDIDALDGFVKGMRKLHPKPEGENPECFCGDAYKMEVLGDYKTLWQWFWMCNNLTYDPESGDTEVLYKHF
jgi:hypothetical protein